MQAKCVPKERYACPTKGPFAEMSTDVEYMERALALAAKGRGRTSPNPMVGCVVARNGSVISEGYHEFVGGPHAEVNALAQVDDASGTTVYLTLEPCTFHGRTPPCIDLVLQKKPARVVVAMEDPNPKVSGAGVRALRDAGIDVSVGVLEAEARKLNEAFVKVITTGMPFVIAKCGMSLDGKIATRTGDSRWVTGESSRRLVHELRDDVDVIMVGSRTVMLDDPSLTTRLETGDVKDPVRVILDAEDYLHGDRRVFKSESNAPTWVAVPEGRDCPWADDVIHLPRTAEGLDVRELMRTLAKREVGTVLIEGGGTTHATAFEAGVVDKVMFFVAPKIIGGRDAVSAVEGRGAERMADVVQLRDMTARAIGEDILIEAYVVKEEAGKN